MAAYPLIEGLAVVLRLQVVHSYPKLVVIAFGDKDGSCRVVRDHAGDDGVLGLHLLVLE